MLLAIDIGNTNIVFGAYDREQWVHHWRIQTDRDKMEDEYAVLLRALFQAERLPEAAFERIALCSVVPPLTDIVSETILKV